MFYAPVSYTHLDVYKRQTDGDELYSSEYKDQSKDQQGFTPDVLPGDF